MKHNFPNGSSHNYTTLSIIIIFKNKLLVFDKLKYEHPLSMQKNDNQREIAKLVKLCKIAFNLHVCNQCTLVYHHQ